jgi:uncharacterized protein YjlB
MIISKDRLRLPHLYTDENGDSTVEEVEYLLERTPYGAKADIAISGITFRIWGGAPQRHDYHNTSKPQLVIHLVGSVSVEGSSGAKAVVGPGDILVSENTTGTGHLSNEIETPRLQLLIPYTEGFLPEAASGPSAADPRSE